MYKQSVEPYHRLFSYQRYWKNPSYKNKQATPTPNMECHQTEQSIEGRSAAGYTYPKGVYCLLALDRLESFQFSDNQNKR
jgi:hypothetical protein